MTENSAVIYGAKINKEHLDRIQGYKTDLFLTEEEQELLSDPLRPWKAKQISLRYVETGGSAYIGIPISVVNGESREINSKLLKSLTNNPAGLAEIIEEQSGITLEERDFTFVHVPF